MVTDDEVARFVPIDDSVEQEGWLIVPKLRLETLRVVRRGQHRLTDHAPVRIENEFDSDDTDAALVSVDKST